MQEERTVQSKASPLSFALLIHVKKKKEEMNNPVLIEKFRHGKNFRQTGRHRERLSEKCGQAGRYRRAGGQVFV